MTSLNHNQNPWKMLLRRARGNSRPGFMKRNGTKRDHWLDVEITEQHLIELYKKQNGRCYWSNYPLNPNDVFKKHCPQSISLDRLDDSRGYVPGNVVLTTRGENLGRKDCPADVYRKYVEERKLYSNNNLEPNTLDFL